MDARRRFDPDSFGVFRVLDRHFDSASRMLRLRYALDGSERALDREVMFEETVTFETVPDQRVPESSPGFERALLHLHIAAGTSYYKAAAPPVVDIDLLGATGLGRDEREFHRRLYDDGLREFAVANGMPVPRQVEIRSNPPADRLTPVVPMGSNRSGSTGLVVPIGGGKDSMVLIEAVRDLRPRLLAVNPHPLTVALAEKSGLPLLVVRRSLSPNLAALNQAGALNGHVPITAIVSLVAVVGSFVYGYDSIAMAIERSASEETLLVGGVPVNHQFSKSLELEHLLARLVRRSIDSRLVYGSGLRPYSELAIARAFARLGEYHQTFCSCNTAFRQGAAAKDRWCGHCPKCRFVALVLAPFLSPGALESIIGRDLFDDHDQVPGFAALMSETDKPFECVGERRESAVAICMLAELPAWRDSVVVAALADQARSRVSPGEVGAALAPVPALGYPDQRVAERVASFLDGSD